VWLKFLTIASKNSVSNCVYMALKRILSGSRLWAVRDALLALDLCSYDVSTLSVPVLDLLLSFLTNKRTYYYVELFLLCSPLYMK